MCAACLFKRGRAYIAKCVCYITTSYFSAVFSLRTWSQDCVHSQYTIMFISRYKVHYGVMDLPLSLSISHSPSLSPSPSPQPLLLCGVDSLPCQLHLLACGGCHHIVIIIYCNPAHLRIMFSQITCNITCYIFLQCH